MTNRPSKKPKKYLLNEQKALTGFIKSLMEKNYAEANKYLKIAVHSKLKSKIEACAKANPF